ncbi:hypothetical protein GDO78_000833 [Eleutherodactylus coqui]|uniref:Uncharacterized protein n=1 Tax=Eleutherodactylus coqui TaxID=57060 RepID=A0A8J6KGW9_ELECQ|nr:hypothetical protein GDO78_000833 [Eleutherodactylus coqui]
MINITIGNEIGVPEQQENSFPTTIRRTWRPDNIANDFKNWCADFAQPPLQIFFKDGHSIYLHVPFRLPILRYQYNGKLTLWVKNHYCNPQQRIGHDTWMIGPTDCSSLQQMCVLINVII